MSARIDVQTSYQAVCDDCGDVSDLYVFEEDAERWAEGHDDAWHERPAHA